MSSPTPSRTGNRQRDRHRSAPMRTYRAPAKVMHWVTAVLVFCMIASGRDRQAARRGASSPNADEPAQDDRRGDARAHRAAPSLSAYSGRAGMGRLRLKRRPVLHWGLYAVVIGVPLLGWAGISDFGAREVAFGIVLPPIRPEGAGYDEILLRIHAYAAFALLALVALHVGIAIQDTMTAGRPGGPTHGE